MQYISNSRSDTQAIAQAFATTLKPGDIVCLNGDLGAGKTAFVSGAVKAFNYTGYVNSPTFTIVNEYHADIAIYHFDVYRIENGEEMYNIGLDEYLFGDGICIIEWAEKIADILPKKIYNVVISKDDYKGDDYRDITITKE